MQSSFVVSGVVKDKSTGAPIKFVHVYTVKGEEEAMTNEKGEFRFETSQRSANLMTEKDGYRGSVTKLELPALKKTILLVRN